MQIAPAEHPIDVQSNLVNIGMKNFPDELYEKQLTYTASLLRKITKLYKDSCVTTHNLMVDKLKKYALNPDIEEIEDIFPQHRNETLDYNETL